MQKITCYITNYNVRKFKGEVEEGAKWSERISYHFFEDCKLLANNTSGYLTFFSEDSPEHHSGVAHRSGKEIICCPECFERKYPGFMLRKSQLIGEELLTKKIEETAKRIARIKFGLK